MAAASSSVSSPLLWFLSLLFLSSISIAIAIKLPISKNFHSNPPQDAYEKLSQLASISQTRAHHLKNPQTNTSTTHLFPHSYGGYTISLSFGTPPQTLPFIMDTGSNFVWFPCTGRYNCKSCNSEPGQIQTFLPKQSSSSRILGCLNPKCGLVHGDLGAQSRCSDCNPGLKNCTQICPPYLILYGSGSTGGIPLVETLDFPGGRKVPDFVIGCSLFSSHQPAGIAGFGRGPSSFPAQIGLRKFSYCLVSHKFDDSYKSGFMEFDGKSTKRTPNLSYTQLLNNPVVAGKSAFSAYYYVGLRRITVGDRRVKIPYQYLSPDSGGNGGTIVDSGTTFTYMAHNVFELVSDAFTEQVKEYERAEDVEVKTGLRPCFNVSGRKTVSLPEMKFYFKGGAEMALPLTNYFSIAGEPDVACLTMVTDRGVGVSAGENSSGPAVILGNFQMQNFHTEFDLENRRFGFGEQQCHE